MKEDLREQYREKAAAPGWGPVLDAADGDGPKNRYLDYVHRRVLRRIVHALGPRAVDLGCGVGRLTSLVGEGRWAIGLDGSPDLLALARGHLGAGVPLVQADVTTLPLASGSLTGALMAQVSMHLADDAAVRTFGEVARVLQPGGHLIVMEHLAPGETDREYHGVHNRARGSMERFLRDGGLVPVGFIAMKKSPSRVVHWVKGGRLPRALWGLGAWLDAKACGRRTELADYLECVVVARKLGGSEIRIETPGLMSLFLPRRRLR